MARDRKRAKQRRARRGPGRGAPAQAPSPAAQPPSPEDVQPEEAPHSSIGQVEREDLPGALEHAGDVDEFDAALVRGAQGVPADSEVVEELEAEAEEVAAQNGSEEAVDELRAEARIERVQEEESRRGIFGRAVGFLRASWAELQRVQWPDRRQVFQATAVVLGFVAIAGLYLGAADYVAKEVVEFILG
ncbi:MAG TPA: preprotein translocase subunit SecE [Solirubrobacteraceae bacterium]|nr:preprotein translocase subunit SecE [Solirubrobacteraceae bacterium]